MLVKRAVLKPVDHALKLSRKWSNLVHQPDINITKVNCPEYSSAPIAKVTSEYQSTAQRAFKQKRR